MAADDFQLMPTWVEPVAWKYPNIITKSESQKKEYFNLSTTPIKQYVLKYEGLSDAQAETLWEHYSGRYGGYDSFAWKNSYIPAYIIDLLDLGAGDLTGRWVDNSLKLTPRSHSYDAEVTFEIAN